MRTQAQVAVEIESFFEKTVADGFKALLEQKHLYQSVDLVIADAIAQFVKSLSTDQSPLASYAATQIFNRPWIVNDPTGRTAYGQGMQRVVIFTMPHIKTFCERCGRIEPFNPVATEDFFKDRRPENAWYVLGTSTVQNFVLSFLCQACKIVPEVFLVRRIANKLTLCGRSPIEHVEVSKVIPDKVKRYVSGAIVAHQSGQTLAGLFLLRTSIEQWIRTLGVPATVKADAALDWYMSTVPADVSGRIPSLRQVYATLSDAIHRADASAALFDEAKKEIEKHFDARRLFEISEPKYGPLESAI
jgi:hypothetical protein